MIAPLHEVDLAIADEVYETMFLRQPSRSRSRQRMLERLGLANPGKRIAHHALNQIERPDRNSALFTDPKPEVLNKLGMEHCQPRDLALPVRATSLVQVRLPCAEL